jgi:predicted nucleotidyltransferase
MNIHKDFEEFLKYLTDEKVEFVIIGGYAVAFHGYVRATNDMDLFFKNSDKNILKIRNALNKFGISTSESDADEFKKSDTILRIGNPPVRIEMSNSISGIEFDDVWENKIKDMYGDVTVYYISFDDLLKNKKTSGRPKDLADYDELGGNRK